MAVGGDGMANLALQAVVGTGTPFGLVAAGTGNDFARALGMPLQDPAAAGRMIADALRCGRGPRRRSRPDRGALVRSRARLRLRLPG